MTEQSLRQAAASSVKWTAMSAGLVFGSQVVRLIALARFLGPRDIGLAAIVSVITGLATAFADGGISMAIIAKQTTQRTILSTLYWSNVVMGILVFVLLLAATPILARLFGEPRLVRLIPLAALVFLIAPIGQQFRVLLERDLRFRVLARIEIAASLIGTAIAVGAAATGFGAASVILGALGTAAVTASLLALRGWRNNRPMLYWRRADLGGYLGFGLYQMGERSLSYLGQNVDYLLIGALLGAAPLGTYSLAYQTVVVPQLQINPIITRVAFPTFARRRDDDVALRNGFLELMRLVALISLPALVGLAIVAPQFVPALFGSKWHGAVVLIQILSLLGITKALGNPFGSVVLAKGRADLSFWATVLQLCFVATGIAIGIQYGVVGAAIGHVIAVNALWVPIAPIYLGVIALPVRRFVTNLAGPAGLAAGMGLVLIGLSIPISRISGGATQMLVIQVMLGAMIYGGLLVWFEWSYLHSLWRLAVHSPAIRTDVELKPIDDK